MTGVNEEDGDSAAPAAGPAAAPKPALTADGPGGGLTGGKYWGTFILAIVLLLGFADACTFLLFVANDGKTSDSIWGRYIYVFGALEGIVFTAVGWIFGREVHRSEANTAKREAAEAKQETKEANATALAGAKETSGSLLDVAGQAKEAQVKGQILADAAKRLAGAPRAGVDGIGGAPRLAEQVERYETIPDLFMAITPSAPVHSTATGDVDRTTAS